MKGLNNDIYEKIIKIIIKEPCKKNIRKLNFSKNMNQILNNMKDKLICDCVIVKNRYIDVCYKHDKINIDYLK